MTTLRSCSTPFFYDTRLKNTLRRTYIRERSFVHVFNQPENQDEKYIYVGRLIIATINRFIYAFNFPVGYL